MHESRYSFTAGNLIRGHVIRELHSGLSTIIGLEYEIKELYNGWIESSYVLILKHKNKEELQIYHKAVGNFFKRIEE